MNSGNVPADFISERQERKTDRQTLTDRLCLSTCSLFVFAYFSFCLFATFCLIVSLCLFVAMFVTLTFKCLFSQGKEHNFKKYDHRMVDNQGKQYDLQSIMHYGNTFFSKNGKPTIQSITQKDLTLGQSVGFTQLDIDEINKLYDCSGKRLNMNKINPELKGMCIIFVFIPFSFLLVESNIVCR